MNEFIEKLIERLEEESDYEPIDYDYCDMSCSDEEHFISTHKAIKIVNQLAKEYNNGWIDCCERLPEHCQTVIFLTEEGMVEAGYYDVNEDWCVNDSYFPNAFRFVAWQPLPEPYKSRQQSQEGGES